MPARLFPYAFLPLLGAVCISASASQDLRYYQDLISEPSSEDIALQYLTKVLKARNQNAAYGQAFFPSHHLDEFEANKQRRKQRRAKEFPANPQERFNSRSLSENSNILHGYITGRDMFNFLNPHGRIYTSPRYNNPLTEQHPPLQNIEYPIHQDRFLHRKPIASESGMKEETLAEIGHRFSTINHQNFGQHFSHGQQRSDITEEKEADFTFELPKPSSWENNHRVPFSRPGDPEFDDGEFSTRFTKAEANIENEEKTERITQLDDADVKTNLNQENNNNINDDEDQAADEDDHVEGSAEILPGLQRRAENHGPMVTAVDHSIGKDIYFVAVVAGCSAAAMFVLVLISLTWCRFQRGAKAAADVEYPAYGVTGPNKDISPSGDRRLAQSAQMYHYQHQKQQIIAMESRTATGRDPGSVSEAESDEENEEGDYTVYECPGLAPTGEMEVKNPLFHDDPTPATPAGPGQSSRSSEDQNM